jgi:hypothetical protein
MPRSRGREHREMFLARYFLYVGGALLALLLIVSAELPQQPATPNTNSAADLPAIRINSDRKWPAKVVFDTSAPTIVPTKVASNAADVKAPAATVQVASTSAPREALAQLAPSDIKKASARKSESKLRQRHKVARRRMYPQPMMVAQQPQFGFGFFGSRIW